MIGTGVIAMFQVDRSRWQRPAATCAACAVFFLLGMISTRSESASSPGFQISSQVRVSRELSGSTGVVRAVSGSTHHIHPGRRPSAPVQTVAKSQKNTPQQANVRDVFWHIESHQVGENKENTFKSKPNLETSELSLVTLCKLSQSRLDIGESRTENGAMIHRWTGISAMGETNS